MQNRSLLDISWVSETVGAEFSDGAGLVATFVHDAALQSRVVHESQRPAASPPRPVKHQLCSRGIRI